MNDDIVSVCDDEAAHGIKLKLQQIEDMEGGLIVHVSGYINTYNSVLFQKRVEQSIEAGFNRLIVEMSQVTYVSNTGWGVLTHLLRLLRSRNGHMVLNRLQPKVLEVARLLGLSQFFIVRSSLDESLEYYSEVAKPVFPEVLACGGSR
jgi:anti-sigma B factor antagonist